MALYTCQQNAQNGCANAADAAQNGCGCAGENAERGCGNVGGAQECGCAAASKSASGELLLFIALILLLIVFLS